MIPLIVYIASLAALGTWATVEHIRAKADEEPSKTLGPREYRVYLGQQRSGKTYQVKRSIGELAGLGITVHVLDHGNEYGDVGQVFKGSDDTAFLEVYELNDRLHRTALVETASGDCGWEQAEVASFYLGADHSGADQTDIVIGEVRT